DKTANLDRHFVGWFLLNASDRRGSVPSFLIQSFRKNYRLIVFFIFRAKKKRQRSMLLLHLFQFSEQPFFLLQLSAVFLLKLRPFFGIVREPVAHTVAWRNLLHPHVDLGGLFLHPPRPQAIHQNSPAVLFRCTVVDSLDPDHLLLHSRIFSTSS